MTRWIIRKFVKDYGNVTDGDVRESYGVLAGVLGIICNLLLFGLKFFIGFAARSIAITSDAFNNLSDTGSSLVAILGAKVSNRPPDREHPHGHGRFEYIAALVVSFIIFSVGLRLLGSSFGKIINPEEVLYSSVTMIVLFASILVKAWMFSYNRYVGDTINSSVNRAAAYDSLNDVVATGGVILGTIIGRYIAFPIDGLMGIAISCLIVYTGFSTAKDSVNALLGTTPDPKLIDSINAMVLSGKNIVGAHDLKIHDYGPGRVTASVHAEVLSNANIVNVHDEIDSIERLIESKLGVSIVIHMDPMDQPYP